MVIYPFPLMDVISQIKAHTFSVSMENQAVRLGYLSKTQINAPNQKRPQNNQLEALNLQNKLMMKNTHTLKPVWKMLTTDGLFWYLHVCLGSSSCHYSFITATREKRQVKLNSKSKIRLCTFSSDMLPKCICPFAASGKMITVNSCICLTSHILLFLTVKELSYTVLAVYNKDSKKLLRSVLVKAYRLQAVKFTLHLVLIACNIVYYNEKLLHIYFLNKEKEHKSIPWLLL